jgi:5-formyltetrahydrofolate cyclo-ligase
MEQASKKVCLHLSDLLAERGVETAFIYSAIHQEIDLIKLMSGNSKFSFALPRITREFEMNFSVVGSQDALQANKYGIWEPKSGSPIVLPTKDDIIFAPSLLLTTNGQRLGRGKGYYDRYLSQLSIRPLVIGINYSSMVLEPNSWGVDPHDKVMDGICTEVGVTFNCQKI